MQKYIIAVVFMCGCLSLRAQNSSNLSEVDAMIKDGVRKHYDQIIAGAGKLSSVERDLLYSKHKQGSASYTLANIYLGPFAIGSMVQGDPLGFAVAGVNIGVLLISTTGTRSGEIEGGYIGTVIGLWFASWFLPSIYSYRHNSTLEEALLLNGISAISITPEFGRLPGGIPRAKVNVNVGF